MKIAVIAKTRLPIAEPFRGGLEAFTHMLCATYVRPGHNVTLYARADSDSRFNIKSFTDPAVYASDYMEIYEADDYASIVNDIEQGGYDIVHNNSTHELPLIWGMTASVPVVTTLHAPPLSKMKAAVTLASPSSNMHFVAVSKSFAKTWAPYTAHGSSVIYNGIDLDAWPLTRTTRDYALWYGRMVHDKGLDIALDAAHAAGLPLHFAGSLDDDTYYTEQIQPRMRPGDVYLGHLTQPEIVPTTKGAAVMINAARWEEPFGLTNIEAMACGVPLAGFDRGAFSEIVTPESGAIAKGTNVSALAGAIKLAVTLDSKAVRQRAEQFSLQALGQRYIQLFEDIL